MKRYLHYFLLIMVLTLLSCNQSASNDYIDMTVKQFQVDASHDFIQLIDVRTPEEFKEGHLEHAINIDFNSKDFLNIIKKLNSDKPVYIYCQSGNRSKKSASYFKEAGFTTIYNLKDGFIEWESEGLPYIVDE